MRSLAVLAAVALLLPQPVAAQTPSPAAAFRSAGEPFVFSFPRDHASHPEYRTEWWYYTGHLRASDGRRFGYELTFFRAGLRPGDPSPSPGQSKWRGNKLFPAHFAITDISGNRFIHTQQIVREAMGQGFASTQSLDVRSGDWTLQGAPQRDPAIERMRLRAAATIDGTSAALVLVQLPLKPPAVHGGGISRKGDCPSCASHYYSYTRLRTTGTLTYEGKTLTVEGTSWMDHEFGSAQLQSGVTGWDWFSIQLDDGREVMLYVLRRRDGSIVPQSSGSLIERDGRLIAIPAGAFTTRAQGKWKSPHTGAVYPSGWRVRVSQANLDVTLSPLVLDQELADPGGVSYWEGAVDVRDASSNLPRGEGYVELTGYAGEVNL